MKKKGGLLLLTLFNIFLIGFCLMKYADSIDLPRLWLQALAVPRGLILAIVALNLVLLGVYGCRLSYLINERFRVGIGVAAVGYAANNLLPLRLGELTRVYFAQKKYDIPSSRSVLALLCERISDLFSIACLTFIALFMTTRRLPVSGILLTLGLITPLMLLIVFIVCKKQGLLKQSFSQHRLYVRYMQPLITELHNLLTLKKGFALLGCTLLIWTGTVTVFFTFFQHSLPAVYFCWLDAICLTVCTSLSIALSTLPSSIGLFEAGIVYYLHTVKNVDETSALSLALVLHALIVVPQILSMSYFLISKYKTKHHVLYSPNYLTEG